MTLLNPLISYSSFVDSLGFLMYRLFFILVISFFNIKENLFILFWIIADSLVAQMVKNLPQCGRPRFNPWIGKLPGEGTGTPVFRLENLKDRGVWRVTVHGVAKSRTRLSG